MEAYMLFLTFSFFLSSFPLSHSEPDNEYSECPPSPCGKLGPIDYPFWSEEIGRPRYCGRSPEFKLNCPLDEDHYPSIEIGSQTFNVKHIDLHSHKMTLVFDNCSSHLTNTSVSIPLNIFQYDEPYMKNVTLFYGCPKDPWPEEFKLTCQPWTSSSSNSSNYAFYSDDVSNQRRFPYLVNNCRLHIQLPLSNSHASLRQPPNYIQDLLDDLGKGFSVQYNTDGSSVAGAGGFGIRKKVILGVVSAVVISGVIGLLLLCKIKSWRRRIGLSETSKVDQNIEAFIRNHGALSLTRYKFADVKKMTNSFKDKLGQGGYGYVYKGKLLNGHRVAVKLLKASKGNGEDFINEVASISRTSHVNVVTLLGFCFEGKHKALIYEFMPNGSLDKFIHNKANKKSLHLTCEKLGQIAIGIARGLEYLHRGCNTRILHFDIKPNNILLDESFCPKISDFGLAKLCPKKESIISISEARGTVGYLAPEVWNRNIGGVSQKSDVYSYGMMLLDMVGERKNMTIEANCSTDKYFPDYIYDQLEQDGNLRCNGANNTWENDIVKRMTIVALWCIQTFPSHRPTMSRVIEMFERRLDLLEIPPKPVISSPPGLELESSTTTNITS